MQQNWAGNLTYTGRIARPASREELAATLASGGPVRALGSRHSFNAIADTPGTLIATDGLPIEIEDADGGVRVSGGARYGDLAPWLDERGLAISNLASLPHISIAGAVATATHGSGDAIGNLATAVREITLLLADGTDLTLRRGDADFAGTVVNLGALGIVTDLVLDTEPTYQVAQTVYEHPGWDAILAGLDAVTSAGTSVSIFTRWQRTDAADQLWVKQRTDRDAPGVPTSLGAVPATVKRHPILGAEPEACTDQLGEPGPWFQRLQHFKLEFTPSAGAEVQTEYLFPRADAPAAIEAVRSLAHKIAPLLLVNEVRTMAADDLWLSGAFGSDAVGLHFTWKPEEAAIRALLPELEAALPASARPHWGKVATFENAAARYPRWAEFAGLRDRLDPDRRFVNPFLAELGL